MLWGVGMGHPLRWNRTDLIYEVTIETIQGRYLLRPSREVRELILGVISRAQALYPAISLYAFMFTRNRGTLLLSTSDEAQLAKFMAYVDGGISRKLGRLLDWSGKLWAGRYRAAPILDEEAITGRLRHLLSQGVDEGLVVSPLDWPGATCAPALVGSMTLDGVWVNRDREARLRASGLEPPASAYVEPYRVKLTPIPAWSALPRQELVGRYRAMIESIEYEQLVITRGVVVDPIELQRQDPFFRPSEPRRRLAQLCHAACETLREGFRAAYRRFCAAFRAAADGLTTRSDEVEALVAGFPGGSNPRPNLHVPLPRGSAPPWWNDAPPVLPPEGEPTLVDEVLTELGGELPTTRWEKLSGALVLGAQPRSGCSLAGKPLRPSEARRPPCDGRPTRPIHPPRPPP